MPREAVARAGHGACAAGVTAAWVGTSYLSPTMRVSRAGDAVDADTLVYVRA